MTWKLPSIVLLALFVMMLASCRSQEQRKFTPVAKPAGQDQSSAQQETYGLSQEDLNRIEKIRSEGTATSRKLIVRVEPATPTTSCVVSSRLETSLPEELREELRNYDSLSEQEQAQFRARLEDFIWNSPEMQQAMEQSRGWAESQARTASQPQQ